VTSDQVGRFLALIGLGDRGRRYWNGDREVRDVGTLVGSARLGAVLGERCPIGRAGVLNDRETPTKVRESPVSATCRERFGGS